MKASCIHFFKAILSSYAIIFFSQSRLLGALLLFVSCFNVPAGLSGLAGAVIAVAYTTYAGYNKSEIEKGLFSFNPLLLGIGLGTFYHQNTAFFIWLIIGCFFCLFITISLRGWFNKHHLPYLSLPFIVSFWIILSAANSIFQMGLQQNSSAILNELNDADNMHSPGVFGLLKSFHLPYYFDLFFKGLSAVFFQNSTIAGILIGLGVFLWSRIAMSLLMLSFITVVLFNHFTGIYPEGISHYHLGINFMLTAMAVGGFFLVPSWRSYLWSVVSVLFTFLLVNAFTRLAGNYDLPVLSLPFCITCILMLAVFKTQPGGVKLTGLQFYSPEENLYQYLNNDQRLNDLKYFNIKLPFLGSWLVSQGYNGGITHKNEWGQALDFVIADQDQKTYQLPGTLPEHYYCYNKPVLACGDGMVAEVIDDVEDNPINKTNLIDNWGNTIVIKHTEGLFSKVAHLKKGSVKVSAGDMVRQGAIIALCGNSGRSPEPHLHFQLQATPYIGSKTIAYPFSYYKSEEVFVSFTVPDDGATVSAVAVDTTLRKAFNFQPGYVAKIKAGNGDEDVFEVYADTHNQTYFYSRDTGAIAYFVNNGTTFFFTAFYGNECSLLYYFYLTAYKIVFTEDGEFDSVYPLSSKGFKPGYWLQDLIGPFKQYITLKYHNQNSKEGARSVIKSEQYLTTSNSRKQIMKASIVVDDGGLRAFTVNHKGNTIVAKWINANTY